MYDTILRRKMIILCISTSNWLFSPKIEIEYILPSQSLGLAGWLIKYGIDEVSNPCG